MEHKIKSFSKINVHLNVIKKLKSNFHRIETLVMFSDLYDLLYVKKINAKKHKITFYGKFSKNISSTNTISKLLDLLDKKKLLKYKYKIKIKKNIPTQSGMGGGSINAATLLNYFNKIEKLYLNKNKLLKICSQIGSDVCLGLNTKNKIITKNGKMREFNKKIKLYLIIVKPDYGCKTGQIYQKVRNYSDFQLSNNKISNVKKLIKLNNDLETIVFKKYPSLGKLKNDLTSLKNILFARMTGSGSALVAYFLTKKDALNGTKLIKKKYKKHWCISSKTI